VLGRIVSDNYATLISSLTQGALVMSRRSLLRDLSACYNPVMLFVKKRQSRSCFSALLKRDPVRQSKTAVCSLLLFETISIAQPSENDIRSSNVRDSNRSCYDKQESFMSKPLFTKDLY